MSIEWLLVRVARKSALAEDIVGLVLETASENPLPPFSAGSHIDIELPNRVTRQYSLCNSPLSRGSYELGVLVDHNGRGGSKAVHDHLSEGATVRISAPRNMFMLVEARHYVLMAGGIGITPVLSMAEELAATGKSFEIHYFVRAQERAAFLDRLSEPRFQGRFHLHVGERIPDSFATDAVLGRVEEGRHLYVCGPNAFLDFVLDTARMNGWPDDQVHSERFTLAPTSIDGDLPFEIEIEGSGRSIHVAAGQTAVAALAGSGVIVPVSCEQGICGTCLMSVVEGIPDHRDMYLSVDEHGANDCFTPCCSRALSQRLVVRL